MENLLIAMAISLFFTAVAQLDKLNREIKYRHL